MNISRRWLEALLGRSLDAGEIAALLTARCCPVEGVERLHADLEQVLVGHVLEVRRHPNADRLSLCLVDAGGGSGPLEVVCGAPNVTAGKRYPFAPVGTVLPGGVKLERRKIRGVESNGMLCSARELGLGQDGDGISTSCRSPTSALRSRSMPTVPTCWGTRASRASSGPRSALR